jgi:fatty-acyl-CoA synthase
MSAVAAETAPSFEPLTPVDFLRRAALVHATRTALVDGSRRLEFGELWERARRLAGLLAATGTEPGDRVAVLAANGELALTAHFGVPPAGAVLVPLNYRLAAGELAEILRRSGARAVLCDTALRGLATEAVSGADVTGGPLVLDADEVRALLDDAPPLDRPLADERGLLSINYTSGTTGRPKGVMYHHRGAYLQSLAMAIHAELRADSVFLGIVPSFHCHGWSFNWATAAVGAVHVCQANADPAAVWEAIERHGVTHLAAAPTVLTGLAAQPGARPPDGRVLRALTGGSPPSPALLDRLGALGIEVTHLYGLTETYGPSMLCDWDPRWDRLPAAERAVRKARQGVANVVAVAPRVLDREGVDVPADGETMGEVALRGNTVMLGYHEDEEATREAVVDGWFRTGDLGVLHPDGYVELRDRGKDVIVSGGENIASVEIEQALASHPAVLETAVVGAPDPRWGERPVAYVTLRSGATAGEAELIAHVRARLAAFKAPREVLFVAELPKTTTGKIRKFDLRARAWAGRDRRIA